jgi:hypothetical protein
MKDAERNERAARLLLRVTDGIAGFPRLDPNADSGVIRDTDGTILRGPCLPCGCPLDAGCDGRHPGALT